MRHVNDRAFDHIHTHTIGICVCTYIFIYVFVKTLNLCIPAASVSLLIECMRVYFFPFSVNASILYIQVKCVCLFVCVVCIYFTVFNFFRCSVSLFIVALHRWSYICNACIYTIHMFVCCISYYDIFVIDMVFFFSSLSLPLSLSHARALFLSCFLFRSFTPFTSFVCIVFRLKSDIIIVIIRS